MAHLLNDVWEELTKNLNDARHSWWEKIKENLTDEKRKAHNLTYLGEKYELYLEIKHLIRNKEAMEYGLFFSYFEYDPKDDMDEERNIEHFKTFCSDCGIPLDSDLFKDVLVLLNALRTHITEEHKSEGVFGSDDSHYFLDLDMAVLGSSPEDYLTYSSHVKEEYNFLPPDSYEALRVKVLQSFLQIPNIFATQYFREKFESQARKNIQDEISKSSSA